jgi:ribosomal protein S18 acetylase RimI-like enzyme
MEIVEIRRIETGDWKALRDVRLRALADAPDAFGTTFAEARERADEWWIDWTERSAEGDEQAMFLAWLGDAAVGIAGIFADDGVWHVISMWVDPAARGRGIGRLLLDAAVWFARAREATAFVLGVTDGNDAARALYEHYGFADNGDCEPLRSNPELTVRYMSLAL